MKKRRARLASPQPRPTSPVNGAWGKTGCLDYAEAPKLVPVAANYFTNYFSPPLEFPQTQLSDGRWENRRVRLTLGS